MYRLEITGRNLDEFKKAVLDINNVLQSGEILGKVEEPLAEEEVIYTPASYGNDTPTLEPAPTVQDITVPSNTELDSEGCPWDKRIHSSGKTKVKDGTWTIKKGSDRSEVAKIKAELISQHASPVVEEPVQVQTAPVVEEPVQVQTAPVIPMPQAGGHTVETFKSTFPMTIASLITEGKLTQEYVNQLKDYFGVSEIWMITDEQKTELFNTWVSNNIITKA